MQKVAILLAALIALSAPALASDTDIGQAEYFNSCAQCHGPIGKGDGEMATFLMKQPADLTQLQKDNSGVFPVKRVYGIIEGSTGASVHGTAEMPAWGKRYSLNAPDALGPYYLPSDREAFVRGRILALVEYLSTLQEQ